MNDADLATLEAADLAAASVDQAPPTTTTPLNPFPDPASVAPVEPAPAVEPLEPVATPPASFNYPIKGFDCYAGVLSAVALAKAAQAGCKFFIHYYGGSSGKDLTKASAIATTQAGMMVGAVYEAGGAEFSAEQGEEDAKAALEFAAHVGQPTGSAIYFAVDTGIIATEGVLAYFGAIAGILRPAGYKVGAYGPGAVLADTLKAGTVDYDWLGGALGWPGSRTYQEPAIAQGLPGDPYGFGFQIDPDVAHKEAGFFQVTA